MRCYASLRSFPDLNSKASALNTVLVCPHTASIDADEGLYASPELSILNSYPEP